MTHVCVRNLTIIGSDNGLSPGRRQAIIWTSARILLDGPLGTNFNEILIKILTFSFRKMRLKVSSAKWRPSCLGLNVIIASTHSIQSVIFPHTSHALRHWLDAYDIKSWTALTSCGQPWNSKLLFQPGKLLLFWLTQWLQDGINKICAEVW